MPVRAGTEKGSPLLCGRCPLCLFCVHAKPSDDLRMGQTLDAFLRLHGSDAAGGYFLGDRYSFAEVATSPFIWRILVVLPHYRGYDGRAVAAEKKLTRLHAWIEVGLLAAEPASYYAISQGLSCQGML